MSILDSQAIIQACLLREKQKDEETIAAGKAFVEYALPLVSKIPIGKFLERIENDRPLVVDFVSYRGPPYGDNLGIYTCLPDGTPIWKVATNTSLMLLSMCLGPRYTVDKHTGHRGDICLIVKFSLHPVVRDKEAANVRRLWPNIDTIKIGPDGVVCWKPEESDGLSPPPLVRRYYPAGPRCPYRAPEIPDCPVCEGSRMVMVDNWEGESHRCPECGGSGCL